MSIASMADGAIQRKRATGPLPAAVVAPPGAADTARRKIVPLKAASDLARYIPSEAIALYVAILSGAFGTLRAKPEQKLSDLDYSTRWHLFFLTLLATAALVWLVYAAKARQTPSAEPRKRRDVPLFEMAIAALAIAGWAAALPDTPFADFGWYGGWFPPIVLTTTTALLPLIAAALGKTPPDYKEAEPTDEQPE